LHRREGFVVRPVVQFAPGVRPSPNRNIGKGVLWMNAFLTKPGRRFLPLLAMSCLLAGLPTEGRAGLLTSRLTDRTTVLSTNSSAAGPSVQVVYESQEGSVSRVRDAEST